MERWFRRHQLQARLCVVVGQFVAGVGGANALFPPPSIRMFVTGCGVALFVLGLVLAGMGVWMELLCRRGLAALAEERE